MMKKILFGLTLLLGFGSLVSCSDNDDADYVTKQLVNSCFAVVNDGTNTATYTNVNFTIWLNYTAGTADVDLTGLGNATQNFYPTLKFRGLKFTADKDGGWKTISGTSVSPSTDSGIRTTVFEKFEIKLLDRVIDNSYTAGFYFTFTTVSGETYTGSVASQTWTGEATSQVAGVDCVSENSVIVVQVDPSSNKLGFVLKEFALAKGEQNYAIVMREIPYTYFAGTVTGALADAKKVDVTGPQATATISNTKITYSYTGEMTLEFDMETADTKAHVTYKAKVSNMSDNPSLGV